MARTAKPWFNKQKNCWMVWLGGKRVKLAEGRKNKKAATNRYDALRFEAPHNPHPDEPVQTVASVIDHPQWKSDWTKSSALRNIQACFNWAARKGLIERNPFRGVTHRGGEPRRNLTDEEFQAILRSTTCGWKRRKPAPGSGSC